MDAKTLLVAALIVIAAAFLAFWYADVRRKRAAQRGGAAPLTPEPLRMGIGFVANFLDTLGIGSYATTTSMLKMWKVIPDERSPAP